MPSLKVLAGKHVHCELAVTYQFTISLPCDGKYKVLFLLCVCITIVI